MSSLYAAATWGAVTQLHMYSSHLILLSYAFNTASVNQAILYSLAGNSAVSRKKATCACKIMKPEPYFSLNVRQNLLKQDKSPKRF